MTSAGLPLPGLHLAEVDGVPAVWADIPGPYAGGLILRVGPADETLRQRGITHMLEHLALFGLDRPGEHSNGQVDSTTLNVHIAAEPVEVAQFLSRAAGQLAQPPVGRLEDEKGVLRAERAQRSPSVLAEMLAWRWGTFPYAMETYPEYGVPTLDADDLAAWAATYACRQNAVLWFTGPPPAGLAVTLHDGVRHAAPDPYASPLPAFPAYFRSSSAAVALHGVLPRSTAALALSGVLRSRLVDDLRTARAAAYSPTSAYRPLTGAVASIAAVSDIVQGRAAEVTDRVMAALGELTAAEGAPREGELAAHRRRTRAGFEAPGAAVSHVTSSAWDLLLGRPTRTLEEILAELDALAPQDVVRSAQELARTLLVQVPGAVEVPPPWVPAPVSASRPVAGPHVFTQRGGEARLVVGDEGVTLRSGSAELTVRQENLAGVAEWDDGGRVVIGTDGIQLAVEPTLWRRGRRAVALVDRSAPWDKVLQLGTRPADAVPKPPSMWARARRSWRGLLLFAALLAWGGVSIAATYRGGEALSGAALGLTGTLVILWIAGLVRAIPQRSPG